MKKALLVILVTLFITISVAGQASREQQRVHRRWWVSMSLASVFDTNITHDERDVNSFGLVPGVGFHFRDNPERPSFEADYEVALHRYTNTDEFDRLSQSFTAAYRKKLFAGLYARTTTEVSLKGSSEDREINNNYVLEQQFQYRFASNTRVAGLAAYRMKRYPTVEEDSNSIDSYVGAKVEQRLRGDRRVELGYRYDHNRAWDPRNNYIRRMYTLEFESPLSTKRRDSVSAEFRYSPRSYENRLTRVNGVRVPRRDERWTLDVVYQRLMRPDLTMEIAYRYEKRDSNDVDKKFSSNVFGLRFSFDKWRWK
jgi:hypothetical protein